MCCRLKRRRRQRRLRRAQLIPQDLGIVLVTPDLLGYLQRLQHGVVVNGRRLCLRLRLGERHLHGDGSLLCLN